MKDTRRLYRLSDSLAKIIGNTTWMISENAAQLAVGLAVNVVIARSLGPQLYGTLSYASSLVAFFSTFVYLGLSGIVVRDLLREDENKATILGTTLLLKEVGAALAFTALVLFLLTSHQRDSRETWVLILLGLGLFLRPFETLNFWFQSRLLSKYTVIAQTAALVVAALAKLVAVNLGASIVTLAAISTLQLSLATALMVILYTKTGESILCWKANIARAKSLLSQSGILVLSGALATANLKIDQVMIRWISGPNEVGIYSVAVTFSEVWYFLPSAIAASVFPKLVEKRGTTDYNALLQTVFDTFFLLAFGIACLTTIVAKPMIATLYGEAYAAASVVLQIHIWAGVFMFHQQILNRWVLMEDALIFHLLNHGAAAALNVILNLVLIPRFGGVGAALATLVSYGASSYFNLFAYSKTRPVAWQISHAYIFPVRMFGLLRHSMTPSSRSKL